MDNSTPEPARGVKVHYFDHSGTAYDHSQWDDDIADGDVLVVVSTTWPPERSVAILFQAWPTAINEGYITDKDNSYRFHAPLPGITIERLSRDFIDPDEDSTKYDESILVARAELAKLQLLEELQ